MNARGPLAGSYPAAVALVAFLLIPYLALTSAINPLGMVLTGDVPLSMQQLQLTTGLSNAAYAFGTVLAIQLSVHLPGRRLLLGYASLFVVASVLVALAPTPGFFIGGHVVQGLATALMLVDAVPPLITKWPASKVPITGGVMNLCIFGAVALGPVAGGIQAGTEHWRALFWIVAGLGAIGLLFAVLTFEDDPPTDSDSPWDLIANVLAGGGTAAAFFGASELATHRMLDLIVMLPLTAGVVMIVLLIVHQYRFREPLMPIEHMASSIPVAAIALAMAAGAASVGLITLAGLAMEMKASPSHTAMLFWPEFGGALLTAIVFGALIRTRYVLTLPITGMLLLCAGAAVLTGLPRGPNVLLALGSGLVGLGVGASVAPALFSAGFSVRSAELQKVIALVELLRAFAAFIAAPVLMHMAMTVSTSPAAGIPTGVWVCLGSAAGGGLFALYVLALGRVRLQRPDLDRWLAGEGPAWDSPPLADGIRGSRAPSPPLGDGRAAVPR